MSLIVLICYDVSNFHVTKVIYNSPFRKYSPLFFALLRIMNRLQHSTFIQRQAEACHIRPIHNAGHLIDGHFLCLQVYFYNIVATTP